jgi:2-polyprenyl-3-methyl-5-hydroxy-6-metoxy-1,4-benzoquinol methylase
VDAESWNERYRRKGYVWTVEPNRFLVDAVEGLAPGRALDLAAGEGRNSVWLANLGWSVTAVDWSEVALDKGRQRAEHAGVAVTWRCEDLTRWRSTGRDFDLVIIVYLQVPGGERVAIWQEAAAAVAPGGHLVVVGHDTANLTGGYGGPSSPAVLYTAAEVAAALDGLLEVERAETVLRPVEDEDGVLHHAIDNLTVAVRRPG